MAARQHAPSRIHELRHTTVSGSLLFSLIWPILLITTILPIIAIVLLLLSIDQTHTLLAAGLSGASLIGTFAIFLSLGRYTREKPDQGETDEVAVNQG